MKVKIKVSVIIPVYKAEKYLPKCLDSVLNQTLKDIEIICVNDKSPDKCDEILKNYSEKDKRIIVINHNENKGACAARNTGLNIAKGEYIRFCDDDDTMNPRACEISYKKTKAENADILYDDMPYNKVINGPIYYRPKVYVWSGVYRTEFLNNNNIRFYEPIKQLCEDGFFNSICVPKAKKIVCIKDKLYNYYRGNPHNTSHNPKETSQYKNRYFIAFKKMHDIWKKEGYFGFNDAKIEFLKRVAADRNYYKSNKDFDKKLVAIIDKDLLKDEVLNLLDKNTRDGIKKMIKNSK